MTQCEHLGDVHGISWLYGIFGNTGLNNAQAAAREQAIGLKATHLVWTGFDTGTGSTAAHGMAYRC